MLKYIFSKFSKTLLVQLWDGNNEGVTLKDNNEVK